MKAVPKERKFVGTTHVPQGVAHSPGRVSLQGAKTVAPPPIPKDSGVKAPDSGKNVAVLSKAVRQVTGDPVAMGAGWAQAIRQKLQGEKKAKAARRKSDKADAAAAAQRRAAMPQSTGPAAPFVPRVSLGGPGSGPQGGGGGSVQGPKQIPAYKPYVAPKQSFLQKVAGKVKDAIGSAPKPIDHTTSKATGPLKIGALTIGQKHADTKVTESKDHPINPLNIKPPKGSSQAPGKSIGPIHVAMATKSKVLTAKIVRPPTKTKRLVAVVRKGKGKAAATRKIAPGKVEKGRR